MTRKSCARISLLAALAVAAVAAAIITRGGRGRDTTAYAFTPPLPSTGFYVAADCDIVTPGIQETCSYPSGTTSVDVGVVMVNIDQAGQDLAAFNFELLADQTIFDPKDGVNTTYDANPDFNQATLTGGWQFLPSPNKDQDPSPSVADSFISAFNTTGLDAPAFPAGSEFTLAFVHYNVVAATGTGVFSLLNVSVADVVGVELLSCNPPGVNGGNCYDATISIVPPDTATPTPTPSDTPTATATPTVTDTPTVTPTPSIPDTDGDGLDDAQEALLGTNPLVADTDGDGLTDGQEVNVTLTDPLKADTDGDGLTDGQEVNVDGTNPLVADSDGDGLSDGYEINVSATDPNNTDSDGDGVHDGAEVNTFFTDPNNPDTDGDGLNDLQEVVIGSNPNNPDTDGDGLTDGQEVLTYGTSPFLADTDGDLLSDATEVNVTNTDPRQADTDHDGLTDGYEVNVTTTDPNDADTDDDGITDGAEANVYHSNPKNGDTDGDTMPDGFEVLNPCLNVTVNDAAADPDLDGVSNLAELAQGTKPCNPDTDGDGFRDKKSTSHAHINADPSVDNCILIVNPSQLNTDGDFIKLPPAIGFDDLTNPTSDALGDACDPDADNDGLANTAELALGPAGASHTLCPSASTNTDPLKNDTDGDGVVDGAECLLGSDPADPASKPPRNPVPDSDLDGLADPVEVLLGMNPNNADTDGDGLTDGSEVKGYGSNPLAADSDGDGCSDGKEAASINADRTVNSIDLLIVASHFGPAGSPAYVLQLDVNRDGQINSVDLLLQGKLFGTC